MKTDMFLSRPNMCVRYAFGVTKNEIRTFLFTVMSINLFSKIAPKQPKNVTNMTITPITIRAIPIENAMSISAF